VTRGNESAAELMPLMCLSDVADYLVLLAEFHYLKALCIQQELSVRKKVCFSYNKM